MSKKGTLARALWPDAALTEVTGSADQVGIVLSTDVQIAPDANPYGISDDFHARCIDAGSNWLPAYRSRGGVLAGVFTQPEPVLVNGSTPFTKFVGECYNPAIGFKGLPIGTPSPVSRCNLLPLITWKNASAADGGPTIVVHNIYAGGVLVWVQWGEHLGLYATRDGEFHAPYGLGEITVDSYGPRRMVGIPIGYRIPTTNYQYAMTVPYAPWLAAFTEVFGTVCADQIVNKVQFQIDPLTKTITDYHRSGVRDGFAWGVSPAVTGIFLSTNTLPSLIRYRASALGVSGRQSLYVLYTESGFDFTFDSRFMGALQKHDALLYKKVRYLQRVKPKALSMVPLSDLHGHMTTQYLHLGAVQLDENGECWPANGQIPPNGVSYGAKMCEMWASSGSIPLVPQGYKVGLEGRTLTGKVNTHRTWPMSRLVLCDETAQRLYGSELRRGLFDSVHQLDGIPLDFGRYEEGRLIAAAASLPDNESEWAGCLKVLAEQARVVLQ